jgi:hypothetical protein
LKNKKERIVRHTSGNDKEFTIFNALLDSMIKKENKESNYNRFFNHIRSPWNFLGLSLIVGGVTALIWVGDIVFSDITVYGKEISVILLGSRVGENISLGIDMRLIFYLLIGLELLVLGLTIRYTKNR